MGILNYGIRKQRGGRISNRGNRLYRMNQMQLRDVKRGYSYIYFCAMLLFKKKKKTNLVIPQIFKNGLKGRSLHKSQSNVTFQSFTLVLLRIIMTKQFLRLLSARLLTHRAGSYFLLWSDTLRTGRSPGSESEAALMWPLTQPFPENTHAWKAEE